MPYAHVLEDGQIDQARRTDVIAIRTRRAVADEIKAQFAFWGFDPPISLAGLWLEGAQLRFGIHDGSGGDVFEGLVQNLQRLAHFQHSNHIPIIAIAVVAERDTKIK